MQHRFEVGNTSVGLYETARTWALAEEAMRRLLKECPDEPATMYDRMAHVGAIQMYTYGVLIRQRTNGAQYYQFTCLSTERRKT